VSVQTHTPTNTARRFVDPEDLACPGCAERPVRCAPPGYWQMRDGRDRGRADRGRVMTGQDTRVGTSITERLVAALTATWRTIQDRHGDVPDVVLTLGSGTLGARRGEVTLGHFAAGRWHATEPTTVPEPEQDDQVGDDQVGDDQVGDEQANEAEESGPEGAAEPGMAELFVGGEGLRRGAREVLATLLHEAAHGVATTRGVKDTSRQGRYHNRRFAELGAAITAYRRAETGGPGTTTTSRNSPPALCGCEPPRRIRVARAVLAAGPIVCGCCGSKFTVDEPDPDSDPDGDPDGGQGEG